MPTIKDFTVEQYGGLDPATKAEINTASQPNETPWDIKWSPEETSVISTQDAVDDVNKAKEQESKLAGLNYATTPGGIQSNKTGKFYNTLKEMAEAEGETSDEDLAKVFETPEEKALSEAKEVADVMGQELDELRSQLDSFQITDTELNSQISAISARWEAEKDAMNDINRRREKAFETLGFRLGSQFSGGIEGGSYGGVLAEERRQGVLRLGEIEAKKQQEISAAKQAARENNWSLYVTKIDMAQDAYNKQIEEVKQLNQNYIDQMEQIKKDKDAINKVTRQVSIDNMVVQLWNQGITDPAQILDYLNFNEEGMTVGDVQVSDIKDSVKFFQDMTEKVDPLQGLTGDVRDFKIFFPDVDMGTPEGYQQYLRFKAQIAAAGRKPSDSDSGTKPTLTANSAMQVPKTNPDGTKGFDYFFIDEYKKKTPITREQYAEFKQQATVGTFNTEEKEQKKEQDKQRMNELLQKSNNGENLDVLTTEEQTELLEFINNL